MDKMIKFSTKLYESLIMRIKELKTKKGLKKVYIINSAIKEYLDKYHPNH